MSSRWIAIGDIHGCSEALAALVTELRPRRDDTLVLLGDYVSNGPDSAGVIDQLIALGGYCRVIPLLGNHDRRLLDAVEGRLKLDEWLPRGGAETLDSYGPGRSLALLPAAHVDFLRRCPRKWETKRYFFVHGNYDADRPLSDQSDEVLLERSLRDSVPGPHCSGRIAVVGHTPHDEVLDLGYLIDVDTGCCYGRWLTALELDSRAIWQVDMTGKLRRG